MCFIISLSYSTLIKVAKHLELVQISLILWSHILWSVKTGLNKESSIWLQNDHRDIMQNLSAPSIFQEECRMKIEHVLFPSVFSKLRIRMSEGHFHCVHTIRFSEPTKIGSLKTDLNPITYRGGSLFGPDHQIIDHNSKTAQSSTSKLSDL